jgi:ABC-type transporter Mla maintaining outer membrane lipid asymmetry permease subunit MlaE
VLLGIALALGLVFAMLRRLAPRLAGVVIATHASAAITAYVLFLAWASMG